MEGGDEQREMSGDRDRLVNSRLAVNNHCTPGRNGCTEGIHRFCRGREIAENLHNRRRKSTCYYQACIEIGQFFLVGQISIPEQVSDLFKRSCACKLVNVVASVN